MSMIRKTIYALFPMWFGTWIFNKFGIAICIHYNRKTNRAIKLHFKTRGEV